MLLQVRTTSSACTGSYSGEMGQMLIQHTINTSGDLDREVEFTSVRAHDPQPKAVSPCHVTCWLVAVSLSIIRYGIL